MHSRTPLAVLALFTLTSGLEAADGLVRVTPLSARTGETFNMIVSIPNCPPATSGVTLDKDSVSRSGSDLTLTWAAQDTCSITFSVVVNAKPVNRDVSLSISGPNPDHSAGASSRVSLGTFSFTIIDTPAIPPGPTPPGIDPQVDAMWDIMSQATCSDQFGSRLSRYYYCIDVVLGNNSGYPLIIAAVGFRRQDGSFEYRESAASYLSTRAVVQTEHVYSARNLTLRGLQSAGLLIAGVAPFGGTAGRKGRIDIWSTLVGSTLATAWDSFIPDRTLRQAADLDDAALRDGKLIPNNSPVRFTIFVERETIAPFLLRTHTQLEADMQAATEHAIALDAAAAKETNPARKKAITSAAAVWHGYADRLEAELQDRAPAAFLKLREAKSKLDAAQTGLSVAADSAKAQSDLAAASARYQTAKGQFEKQLVESDARTSQRKSQSKAPIHPLARQAAPLEQNLLAVRRALGNIIIVGDQIEYKQRIQVDASAVVPTIEPGPVVMSSQGTVTQGTPSDVILLGKWLAKAQVTPVKCSPIFKQIPDSSGNALTLQGFTVTGCAESSIPLLVDNGSSAVIYNLPITPKPKPDTPAVVPIDGAGKVKFTLTGTALAGATVKALTFKNAAAAAPVPDKNPTATATDTSITITAAVPDGFVKADTTATLQIATPKGGDSDALDLVFTLLAPTLDAPANATITLDDKGKATFNLTGKNLTGSTVTIDLKASDNSKLTLNPDTNPTLTDTTLQAVATIPAGFAKAGTAATVNVATQTGKAAATFQLQPKQ